MGTRYKQEKRQYSFTDKNAQTFKQNLNSTFDKYFLIFLGLLDLVSLSIHLTLCNLCVICNLDFIPLYSNVA